MSVYVRAIFLLSFFSCASSIEPIENGASLVPVPISAPISIPTTTSLREMLLYGGWSGKQGRICVVGVKTGPESFGTPMQSLVMCSLDEGSHWNSTEIDKPVDDSPSFTELYSASRLLAVWGDNQGNIYAVGDSGLIVHSNDDGKSWYREQSPSSLDLRAVWGGSSGEVFAAGGILENDESLKNKGKVRGVILRSLDYGKTWIKTDFPSALLTLWVSSSGKAWAGGDYGSLFSSVDQGLTWVRELGDERPPLHSDIFNGDGSIISITGSSANDLYLTSHNGYIAQSHNGGTTWEVSTTYSWGNLSLWPDPEGLLLIENRLVYYSTDNVNWEANFHENAALPTTYNASASWRSPTGDIYLLGHQERMILNPVFYSNTGCLHYGSPFSSPCPESLDTGSDKNFLWRSRDRGATWEDVATGKSIEPPQKIEPKIKYTYPQKSYDCSQRAQKKFCSLVE